MARVEGEIAVTEGFIRRRRRLVGRISAEEGIKGISRRDIGGGLEVHVGFAEDTDIPVCGLNGKDLLHSSERVMRVIKYDGEGNTLREIVYRSIGVDTPVPRGGRVVVRSGNVEFKARHIR